jgi:hypothetical protein
MSRLFSHESMKFNSRIALVSIAVGVVAALPVIAQPDSKTFTLKSQYFTHSGRATTYIIPCRLQNIFKIGKDDLEDKDYCDRSAARFDRVIMYKPYKNRTGCTLVYADNRREDIGRCILFDPNGRELEWGK